MKNGVLLINKPECLTSRDVVNKVSKILHTKKVGHTGTLDPMATGVLMLCVGSYTKLVDTLTSKDKEYIATMKLGIETDTLDTTGTIITEEKVCITKEKIVAVFKNFPKEYDQEVPKYSAVKINGKKLYEYARKGIDIPLPKRKVSIYSLEILNINGNEITFKTTVSKGTYIRSLIRDLGHMLKTHAVMSSLKRTKQGNFDITKCQELSRLDENTHLLTLDDLFNYEHITIDENIYKKVLNGNRLYLSSNSPYILLVYNNKTIALYVKNNEYYNIFFKEI